MSATASRRDKWPLPVYWRHVWVRFQPTHPTPAPYPGIVVQWDHKGSVELGTRRSIALVIYIKEEGQPWDGRTKNDTGYRIEWIDSRYLRPAASDYNRAWNVWQR